MTITIDHGASKHGLPDSLLIPIAATSEAAIKTYVGRVIEAKERSGGGFNGLVVEGEQPKRDMRIPLWSHKDADFYYAQLFPLKQIWVHVLYTGYREYYIKHGMPFDQSFFLDHVQNREAMKLRIPGLGTPTVHYYLRLCPVSRAVNTSGGNQSGGEGIEKAYIKNLATRNVVLPQLNSITYADPMDLTKMINVKPGTGNLSGVGDSLKLFYP